MDLVESTIEKVRTTIERHDMTWSGDRVVVAVSGGPDSVCLLDILFALKDQLEIDLVVAHFDHGLRPEEDDRETRFVAALAASLGLPFETAKAALAKGSQKGSLEDRAREARYAFLEEVTHKTSAQRIALGHNLNDQAETVLMRLLRGSGPSGLRGIPAVREGRIVRPLIETTRREVEAYLDRRGLAYMTDSTNLQRRFLRNRIRLELLPQLAAYQPRIIELLGKGARIMESVDQYLEAQAEEWLRKEVEIESPTRVRVPLVSFLHLPEVLRNSVIRRMIRTLKGDLKRIGLVHVEAVHRLARGARAQAAINLPGGLIAKKVYDRLEFTLSDGQRTEDYCFILGGPGTFYLDPIGCTVRLESLGISSIQPMKAPSFTAYLDADKIVYPLFVRNSRPGDWLIPFGMTGRKKLKDLFIDMKIPSDARRRLPVLAQGSTVLWVYGLRIDDRFKITRQTKHMLKVTVTNPEF